MTLSVLDDCDSHRQYSFVCLFVCLSVSLFIVYPHNSCIISVCFRVVLCFLFVLFVLFRCVCVCGCVCVCVIYFYFLMEVDIFVVGTTNIHCFVKALFWGSGDSSVVRAPDS